MKARHLFPCFAGQYVIIIIIIIINEHIDIDCDRNYLIDFAQLYGHLLLSLWVGRPAVAETRERRQTVGRASRQVNSRRPTAVQCSAEPLIDSVSAAVDITDVYNI